VTWNLSSATGRRKTKEMLHEVHGLIKGHVKNTMEAKCRKSRYKTKKKINCRQHSRIAINTFDWRLSNEYEPDKNPSQYGDPVTSTWSKRSEQVLHIDMIAAKLWKRTNFRKQSGKWQKIIDLFSTAHLRAIGTERNKAASRAQRSSRNSNTIFLKKKKFLYAEGEQIFNSEKSIFSKSLFYLRRWFVVLLSLDTAVSWLNRPLRVLYI